MVTLQKWSLEWRENGHVTVGGQFNGRRMIMLQRWIVSWSEEWSCYRGGH